MSEPIAICVPDPLQPLVENFIKNNHLHLILKNKDESAASIVEAEGESDNQTIYTKSKISCSAAWATANRLKISIPHMGELLNLLKIKVYQCNLGCF